MNAHPSSPARFPLKSPNGGVGRAWLRHLGVAALLMATVPSLAQNLDSMSGDQLMTLMQSQPRLAVNQPVAPTARVDPPVISAGGQAFYRVSLHALDEAITHWPEPLPDAAR